MWRVLQLAPAYEGVELGIGDAVLQKAIVGATGRSAKDVRGRRGPSRGVSPFAGSPTQGVFPDSAKWPLFHEIASLCRGLFLRCKAR